MVKIKEDITEKYLRNINTDTPRGQNKKGGDFPMTQKEADEMFTLEIRDICETIGRRIW